MNRKRILLGIFTLLVFMSCEIGGSNTPPTADSGADKTVTLGETVTLDGSESSDADGDVLTYLWAEVSLPTGSNTVLSDTDIVNPSLTPDISGVYTYQLIVSDGIVNSSADTVQITVNDEVNTKPVANAGNDETIVLSSSIELDGSGSYDADEDDFSYLWSITDSPEGSNPQLSDPVVFNPVMTPDMAGGYTVQLVVNDGKIDSDPDTVVITVENTAPKAEPGEDRSCFLGDTISLDGSGSNDDNGNSLTYSWSINTAPTGSTAAISDAADVKPSFTPDLIGDYIIGLVVNDGNLDSSPASFVLKVTYKGAEKTDTILSGAVTTSEKQYPIHYGMSLYNNELYLTDWTHNNMTKVSLSDNSVVGGYPETLAFVDLPHGVAVDPSDGSIWICDLNNKIMRHYKPDLSHQENLSLGTDIKPLNVVIYNGVMYIAVRGENKIYKVKLSYTTDISSFSIASLAEDQASNCMDMFVYREKLYLVSDQLNGFIRMNLDGTGQEVVTIIEGVKSVGLYIVDDRIYMNCQKQILVTDLAGKPVNQWDLEQPAGYKDGEYIDMEIVNGKIYIASSWGTYTEGAGHILVYEEN